MQLPLSSHILLYLHNELLFLPLYLASWSIGFSISLLLAVLLGRQLGNLALG